jgi:hypothetical protein
VEELAAQIRNFCIALGFLFGRNSALFTATSTWISHIDDFSERYRTCLVADPQFLMKIVAHIETRTQLLFQGFFESPANQNVIPWYNINYVSSQRAVCDGSHLTTMIPTSILASFEKGHNKKNSYADSSDSPSDNKARKNRASDSPKKSSSFINKDKEFFLSNGEKFDKFKLAASTKPSTLPSVPGSNQAICLHFQLIGHCNKKDCPDFHRRLFNDTRTKFHAWIKSIRQKKSPPNEAKDNENSVDPDFR